MNKDWLEILSICVGLAGAVFGMLMWYKSAVEKSYAAQRDFQHLKRNQEQIASLLSANMEELERQFNQIDKDLTELRNWIQNLAVLYRGEGSTGIKRDNRDN